jgi:hypothetical protein
MTTEKLQQELENLQTIIKSTEAVDECTTADLELIASEINHSLANPDESQPLEAFTQRLEVEALTFAESHPTLAAATRQVIELLKNMGI